MLYYTLFVACVALVLWVIGSSENSLREEIITKERALRFLTLREWFAAKLFRLAMWVGGIKVAEEESEG